MKNFKVGAYVTTGLGGGMTGEIVGIHSESELTGNFYIIRILDKSSNDYISWSPVPDKEETWEKYPYEYVVLCEEILMAAPEELVSTLRSLGKIPERVICLKTYSILQNEKILKNAIKNLKIDETHLKKFLRKVAEEYIRVLRIEGGKVHEIYPLDFIVRIKAKYGYGGFKHIRIPIADFFEGKSNIARLGLEMRKTIKELCNPVVKKISKVPNFSKFVVTKEMSNKDTVLRETPKKKKNNKLNKKA